MNLQNICFFHGDNTEIADAVYIRSDLNKNEFDQKKIKAKLIYYVYKTG